MPKLSELNGQTVRLSDLQNQPITDSSEQAQDAPPERSLYKRINDFGNNMGDAALHHLGNLPLGIAQGIMHLNAASPIGGGLKGMTRDLDSYIQRREQVYQKATPDTAGSYIGAGVGETLPWLTGIGELRALGVLPKATTYLGKLGTLATEGALIGASQPVTSGPQTNLQDLVEGRAPALSYADQKAMQVGFGAATGPLMKVGLDTGGLLAGGVRSAVQHATNPELIANANVSRLLGNVPDVVANLRNSANFVPGEQPSVAQALQTPEAVQIERSLRNNPATAPLFAAQDNANNQTRMAVISQLAGTDADIEAAKAARRQAIDPFVSQNLTDSRPITRWSQAAQPIEEALSKPMARGDDFRALQGAQKVIRDVKSGSLQEDDAFDALKQLSDSVSGKNAKNAFSAANAAIDRNMVDPTGVLDALAKLKNSPIGIIGDNGTKLGQLADSIRGAMNIRGKIGTDMLDAVRQEASKLVGNSNSQSALIYGPAKDSIVNAIERVAPGYRDYLATYAKASEPINTMQQVGGILDPNRSGVLNAAGDPQLTLANVKGLLRTDADAAYPMSAGARSQVEGVRDSLLRRSISDAKISAAGPSTAADLKARGLLSGAIYGPNLGVKGGWLGRSIGSSVGGLLGSAFGPVGTGLGAAAGLGVSDAIGAINNRVAQRVGQKMANANLAADAIEQYQARQAARQQQAGLLNYYLYGLPAPVTTRR